MLSFLKLINYQNKRSTADSQLIVSEALIVLILNSGSVVRSLGSAIPLRGIDIWVL